jgi:hypothetical protein
MGDFSQRNRTQTHDVDALPGCGFQGVQRYTAAMPLNGTAVLKLQLALTRHLQDLEASVKKKGNPTYEELLEIQQWSLHTQQGFNDIVAKVIYREAHESGGGASIHRS